MIKKIRIMLIEENRLLREGISTLLNKQKDIKVLTNTGTEDIFILMDKLKPDVMLIDIGLKYQNSLQLVKQIREYDNDSKIIVLDLIPSQTDVLEYVQAGVLGFILKEADNTQFIKAIRKVARGLKVLPPNLTGALFTQISEHKNINSKPDLISQLVKMTKRELEIVKLVADGFTNKEIAQELSLSNYTVKSHVHNILEKLSLHTRVHIAKFYNATKSYNAESDSTSLPGE